jgi:hypothetical protein
MVQANELRKEHPMKQSLLVIVLVGAVAFVLQGCVGLTPVLGSGHLTEEMRQVKDVHEIALAGPGTLHIELGRKEALRLEAEDNLLPYLETKVEGDRLRIGVRKGVLLQNTRPIHVYLTVKNLKALVLSGSGTIVASDLQAASFAVSISGSGQVELDDLQASNVRLKISGSGDLSLGDLQAATLGVDITGSGDLRIAAGEVNQQAIAISGSGTYTARGLDSIDASARISGSGSATIQVREQLEARITGSGNVHYLGRPAVETAVTGSGDVKPLGG